VSNLTNLTQRIANNRAVAIMGVREFARAHYATYRPTRETHSCRRVYSVSVVAPTLGDSRPHPLHHPPSQRRATHHISHAQRPHYATRAPRHASLPRQTHTTTGDWYECMSISKLNSTLAYLSSPSLGLDVAHDSQLSTLALCSADSSDVSMALFKWVTRTL